MFRRFGVAALSFVFVVGVLAANRGEPAQQNAVLRGTVTDASGAAVPNASITIVDARSNEIAHAATDGSGSYELTTLGTRLRPLGGMVVVDGVQIKTLSGLQDCKKTQGVPVGHFNIGAEWTVSRANGLILNARTLETTSQFVDIDNMQSIPGWRG